MLIAEDSDVEAFRKRQEQNGTGAERMTTAQPQAPFRGKPPEELPTEHDIEKLRSGLLAFPGGHGHVTPRPDGIKARCGGPSLCGVCAAEGGLKLYYAKNPKQNPGLEHVPESNLQRPDQSPHASSLTDDLQRLLLVVPMVEAQREVIARAVRVLKALG